MSLDEGLKTIRRRRPEAQPIPAFYSMLQEYETKQQQVKKDENSSKSKRPAAGAVGPTIGPSPPPSKKQRQEGDAKSSKSKVIGPAMPPKSTEK
jgi:hypothetical protein